MGNLQAELYSLKWWFDVNYTRKEQKYRRLQALGDKDAEKELLKLYRDAEDKRKRIQELEKLLNIEEEPPTFS